LKSGVNGLIRKALLSDGIPTLTKFDSGGMIGVTNIPERIPSSCLVMMRIEHGKRHTIADDINPGDTRTRHLLRLTGLRDLRPRGRDTSPRLPPSSERPSTGRQLIPRVDTVGDEER